jgi:acetyl-CoA carboxylase biotin carboxyl carrier protein
VAPPAPVEPAEPDDYITSPFLGTLFLMPQPGAPPFVKVGDEVSATRT